MGSTQGKGSTASSTSTVGLLVCLLMLFVLPVVVSPLLVSGTFHGAVLLVCFG